MVERCSFCGLLASQDYPNSGYFNLNNLIYCSVGCFNDKDKEGQKSTKIKINNKTNQNNKKFKKILKKKSKQKKRS